jgi:PPOX class probable F420-dependent enzyme
MSLIPESHQDLVRRPLIAHVATLRPDGTPQVNPMCFKWDGDRFWLTSTTDRYKYRNISGNPAIALSVNDPELSHRYIEIRGVVEAVKPDPTASVYLEIAKHYEFPIDGLPPWAERCVAYVVRPTGSSYDRIELPKTLDTGAV